MVSPEVGLLLGGLAGIAVGVLIAAGYFSLKARNELAQEYNKRLKPAYEKAIAKQQLAQIVKEERNERPTDDSFVALSQQYHQLLEEYIEAATEYNTLIESMHRSRAMCDWPIIRRHIRAGRLRSRLDYGFEVNEAAALERTEKPPKTKKEDSGTEQKSRKR